MDAFDFKIRFWLDESTFLLYLWHMLVYLILHIILTFLSFKLEKNCLPKIMDLNYMESVCSVLRILSQNNLKINVKLYGKPVFNLKNHISNAHKYKVFYSVLIPLSNHVPNPYREWSCWPQIATVLFWLHSTTSYHSILLQGRHFSTLWNDQRASMLIFNSIDLIKKFPQLFKVEVLVIFCKTSMQRVAKDT